MKDLHIHTKYSDGEYNEYEILKKIKEAGIDEFAICDHDTIEGAIKVSKLLDDSMIFHMGVEVTSRSDNVLGGINMHLLVRNFDKNDAGIRRIIEKGAKLRKEKIQLMIDLIQEVYGVHISMDRVNELEKTTNSIGKPHMYKLLCEHGDYDREEYYSYMNKLKSDHLKVDAEYVLANITNPNTYVTLAHPIEIMEEHKVSYEDIDKIVAYLAKIGLKGLETKHSKHTEKDIEIFSSIAKKYKLIETEGSDYHGPTVKPHVKLGVCIKK